MLSKCLHEPSVLKGQIDIRRSSLSDIYPSSVTKHKKRKQIRVQKQLNASWTFSSDDEAQTGGNSNKTTQKTKVKPINQKSKRIFQSKLNIDTDSDSDDGTFKPRRKYNYKLSDMSSSTTTKVSGCVMTTSDVGDRLPVQSDQSLFKTPKPLRTNKVVNGGNKENEFITPTKGRVVYTPVSAAYISLSSASEDESLGFVVTPSPSVSIPTSKGSAMPKNLLNFQMPKGERHSETASLAVRSCSTTCTFLESLSNTIEHNRRHAEASRFVIAKFSPLFVIPSIVSAIVDKTINFFCMYQLFQISSLNYHVSLGN